MKNKDILLHGEKIALKLCTNELWHEFYKNYVPDPVLGANEYAYGFEHVQKAYHAKTNDGTRMYFSILLQGKIIGEIYLKHMDKENKTTEFGIALINDSVKGQGYGTEAINLLINFAFNSLGFESIFADSILANLRSQHVLKKTGFVCTHHDSMFKYYKLEKNGLKR